MSKNNQSRFSNSFVFRQWDKILFLILFAGFVLMIPGQNVYLQHSQIGKTLVTAIDFPMPTPAPLPVNKNQYYPSFEVTAQGVVILDIPSNTTLYMRNADEILAPASTTKILSALVVLDAFSLDEVVTVKTIMDEGAVMELVQGEQITVENLLYGMLIQSGNDAAWALAEYYEGGVEKFVEAMNRKAKMLHLDHSYFTNPVGYDDPNHKMTANDLARLASFALSNKTIAKMVAIPQITVSDIHFTHFHYLANVNALLGKIPGVGGIKTGWTEEAGENLVTLIERNGRKLIIVVLKSADRFADTSFLIDWIFANYEWQVFSPS